MKMLQVTIRTKKFEEELAFYKEIVGLKIVRDLREKGRGIVFLADSEGDTCIEIIDTPNAVMQIRCGRDCSHLGWKSHRSRARCRM